MAEIDKLYEIVNKHGASDLHLKADSPPILRISGTPRELNSRPLTNEDLQRLVYGMLTPEQIKEFETTGDLDIAYAPKDIGRYRVNLFRQRGSISMAARRVNADIPTFKDLHLPECLADIALLHQGLVLICGITGSGKSTSLAAMIQHINNNRRCHIVTIEDPIEYMYTDSKAFINQREVGLDVTDFKKALRGVVRQDPDVILVGEMRDAETFGTAVEAAATGHLVFGTLHSGTVPQSFSRIYDIFPQEERSSVRTSLMFNLKAIICQKLAPTVDGKGRVPIHEIMITNPSIEKLIETGEEQKIGDVLRVSEKEGMCDFNQSLYNRIKDGFITEETGISFSNNPEQLRMNLKGIFISDSAILK